MAQTGRRRRERVVPRRVLSVGAAVGNGNQCVTRIALQECAEGRARCCRSPRAAYYLGSRRRRGSVRNHGADRMQCAWKTRTIGFSRCKTSSVVER
eukprot:9157048-Pyramimonas_sp.AAC.1